jgi:prepilin-type N-terminal cleavage/methylation domain-containing protein
MKHRRGYTLLEISCVVAMIALLAGLAVPFVVRLSEGHIDASADIVRARLADARSMAIDLNKPVRFGYIPGTGRFQVAPDDDNVLWDSTTVTGDNCIRGELLQDIVFGTDAASLQNSDSASDGGAWKTGCVFLPEGGLRGPTNPDGTYSDDGKFYFGRPGTAPLVVELHGITGTVKIYDPGDEGK